jgi:hypothetical protein
MKCNSSFHAILFEFLFFHANITIRYHTCDVCVEIQPIKCSLSAVARQASQQAESNLEKNHFKQDFQGWNRKDYVAEPLSHFWHPSLFAAHLNFIRILLYVQKALKKSGF